MPDAQLFRSRTRTSAVPVLQEPIMAAENFGAFFLNFTQFTIKKKGDYGILS